MTDFASPLADLSVDLRESWGSGGVFDLELSASEALSGWSIAFDFAGEIGDIWNARVASKSGDRYVIEAVSYNAALGAGDMVEIGWVSSGAATVVTPVSINDAAFAMVMGVDDAGDDHGDHDDMGDDDQGDDHMDHDDHSGHVTDGGYTDITAFGVHHGTSSHTHHDDLLDGRTPITTEAMVAHTALRAFFGLEAVDMETVGQWAFDNGMTNNTQAWGGDIYGVGLYYAMQGAKVGWIRDDAYDPQLIADIQREARLGDPAVVFEMVEANGHEGFAAYLAEHGLEEAFLNTLKMEPHYGGWMHGRVHGWLNLPNGAIAHDVNHLTVLSHDQTQPFMNDTFDWPQWPALDVPDQDVIDYFQSMVVLGDPLGDAIPAGTTGAPITPDVPLPDQPDDDPPDQDDDAGGDLDGEHGGQDHGSADDPSPMTGSASADNMTGGQGEDTMSGLGGDDRLHGRGGADRVEGGGGDDWVHGGGGADWLHGRRGDDVVKGGGGDDWMHGGGGADRLNGGRGDDTIKGGGGADVIMAGPGGDVLVGGGGADRFVFAASHGDNVIRDFRIGLDQLKIKGADDLADLDINDSGAGAVVSFGALEITLLHVASDDLTAADFLF